MRKHLMAKVAVLAIMGGSAIVGSSGAVSAAPPEPGVDLVRIVNEFVPKTEIIRALKAAKKLNPKAGVVVMKASGACKASGSKVTMASTAGLCVVTYRQANKSAQKGTKGKYTIKVISG